MRKGFSFLITFISFSLVTAQDSYTKNELANVTQYIFNLHLNDDNNSITGETEVTVNLKEDATKFELDLIAKQDVFGMEVLEIFDGDNKVDYTYANNKIAIAVAPIGNQNKHFKIRYKGIPERGLVIDTTKFGQRSFFGDNWPNLARHWLACVDHPYDKASVEFRITAPEHYDVVATGEKIEESNLGNGFKLTRYKEPAPVAMKVVTIGVTQFASVLLDEVDDIKISAWVYPENRLDGFSDYSVSSKVLKYFIDNVGPYSYAKLANMQAKTQWGGLENAGTIAYFENSVTGKNTVEPLIAHEIAHQWFGNSATEKSWNHVWLSEGFATYFATLYLESVYGDERRMAEAKEDRQNVIDYYKKKKAPIIDLTIIDPMKVLSTNSYQKGGWVLHMLRHKIGDEHFWKGIREYYKTYQNSNVLTDDFRAVMEQVSGQNLKAFFQQWLNTSGHPELKWSYKTKGKKVFVTITQLQKQHVFKFPLEIGLVTENETEIQTIEITKDTETFELNTAKKPTSVVLDPNIWMLFDEK